MQSIAQILASELGQPVQYVENVIALLDEGSTIPFIARYRKEQHGSMDDTTLRKLEDRLQYLRNLDKRRQEVKSAIEGQGKLTEALTAAIDNAATLAEVEDLYRPYKQKRRTRATVAREKGLEPLAQLLLAQEKDCPAPEAAAQAYIDPEKGVETAADALQGANDIIAEIISDDADIRKALRGLLMRQGRLRSLAATEEDSVYRLYYDFEQPIPKLAGHQILAINRGEKEGLLSVTVLLDREAALPALRRAVVKPGSAAMEFIKAACEDAYDRLIYPSLEREARSALTDSANEGAIGQFALNLKPLLLQPPVKGHVTMGLDPGYAHGCKVAVIDGTGKVRGVFDVNFDKREFSAVHIMDGWRTWAMRDVSPSVYHATRSRFTSGDEQLSKLLELLDDKEITSAGHLSARNFSFSDEIMIEEGGKLNFYVDADFDVDAAFGTFVLTDKNDDWLNIYANYDIAQGKPCDTLELTLCKGDGSEESWSYQLNAAEQDVLLRKMEAFCQQQTGMSLCEYAQQLREEQAQTSEMQM